MSATARLLDGSLEKSAAFLDLARQLADKVALERRPTFDLLLAEVSLVLARWRGDLDMVPHLASLRRYRPRKRRQVGRCRLFAMVSDR